MSFVIFRDQKSFMGYFRQEPGPETADLYKKLTDEEYGELQEAWAEHQNGPCAETVAEIADACLDLIYVATGLMHALGLDPQPLWNEVHRSNVDKIKHRCGSCLGGGSIAEPVTETYEQVTACKDCGGQGYIYEVRLREDGKVLKPEGWLPPELLALVRGQLRSQAAGRIK